MSNKLKSIPYHPHQYQYIITPFPANNGNSLVLSGVLGVCKYNIQGWNNEKPKSSALC